MNYEQCIDKIMSNYSKQPLEQLKLIHPTLTDEDFMEFIELRDDGDGEVYIGKWEHPSLPEPTEQQLIDTKAAAEVVATKQELAGTLNQDLMAEFNKLDHATRKKWYKNGTKAAVVEALKDKDLAVARDIIDESLAQDLEVTVKASMLALIDNLTT